MNQLKKSVTFIIRSLPYSLIFLISILYFLIFAWHVCFYQEKSTLFLLTLEYLTSSLEQPGGFLIYLGSFFSAFFQYPLAGSIVIASVLALFTFLISRILVITGNNRTLFIPLLAAAGLFFFQTNYQYLFYNNLGLLLQVLFFLLTIRFMKGWLPVALIPFWYFLTGGFAWIYLVMYIIYMFFIIRGRGWIKAAAMVLVMLIALGISSEFLFFRSFKSLLIYPYSNNDIGVQFKLFIPFVGFIAMLPLISIIRIKSFAGTGIVASIIKNSAVAIPLFLMLVTAFFRYDLKTKQYFKVEKLFYDNRFDEIISFNTENPSNNILTNYLNNIALCETGKLNDILFHFRQSPDGQTLFLKWEMYWEVLRRGSYFYYTVGMINEAHRWAFENMVMRGHSPEGVKMLIRTELINDNYKMAAKYIGILKKSLFYRKDGRRFEKFLYDDAAVVSDPELGTKRMLKIENDFFSITDDPYSNIEMLLGSDSLNRYAMEYKLAFLMLQEDLESIAGEIASLERFGFTKLPVHIEEAVMAYQLMTNGILPDMGNFEIDNRTVTLFSQFLQTFQFFGNDLKAAEPALRERFGNTYWYYMFYR